MPEKYWILPEVRDLDTATVLCAQTLTSYKNQKLGSRYEFGERPCVVRQLPSANSQVQRIERDERMGSKQSKPAATKGASFPTGKPILVYWNLCGRGDIVQCLFHAANVEYDLDSENANSWPAYKEQCPFGQLPVLKHGDGLVLAQGGAINRYAARLGGLYPTDPVEASRCDMIIEEVMDVFSCLFKVSVCLCCPTQHKSEMFPCFQTNCSSFSSPNMRPTKKLSLQNGPRSRMNIYRSTLVTLRRFS